MGNVGLQLTLAIALVGPANGEMRHYAMQSGPGTRIELHVEKTGLLRGKIHVFLFERSSGALKYDQHQPEDSIVGVTIEASSAKCQDTWVSGKDLAKIQSFAVRDMLAADKFPTISFASSGITRAVDGKWEVRGTLTLRGVAKPVRAIVTFQENPDRDLVFLGNAQVRLTEFGLKPPTAALGAVGTKDEMSLSFQLSFKLVASGR